MPRRVLNLHVEMIRPYHGSGEVRPPHHDRKATVVTARRLAVGDPEVEGSADFWRPPPVKVLGVELQADPDGAPARKSLAEFAARFPVSVSKAPVFAPPLPEIFAAWFAGHAEVEG